MTFAGSFGVPRRHWDITFKDAPFRLDFPPAVDLLMAGVGIGGILAATAVLMYVAIAVKSVFLGERLDEAALEAARAPGATARERRGIPQGVLRLPRQSHEGDHAEEAHRIGAPGTVVLVGVFLAVFVLYYFTNWKVLSLIWKIG
jgi:cytochrome c oxidase subunit 1